MNYIHTNGIIIEGLSCSGKTSVFNAVKKLHGTSFERSIIAFSENYSQILYKKDNGTFTLSKNDHRNLLNSQLDKINKLGEWGDFLGKSTIASRGIFILLERFHINHQVSFPNSNINKIEDNIIKCNLKTILLTISPDKVYERLLFRFKGDREKVNREIKTYQSQQLKYISLVKQSKIESKIINTDNMDWDSIATQALKFSGYSF